jgi:predicted chitinase
VLPGKGTQIGRGYLQITGNRNYQAAAKFLNQSLEQTIVQLATDPRTAARVSAWYWHGRTTGRDINPFADIWNIDAVSQLVNAGRLNPTHGGRPVQINDLTKRKEYSKKALDAINAAFNLTG